jgi:hypothetical protein
MSRDPTEVRARYKVKEAVLKKWYETFEKMMSGDPLAREQMPVLTKELEEANRRFSEEARHFVKWGPKM